MMFSLSYIISVALGLLLLNTGIPSSSKQLLKFWYFACLLSRFGENNNYFIYI